MFGLVGVVSIEGVPDGDRGECAVGEGGQEVGCGTQGGADALVHPVGGSQTATERMIPLVSVTTRTPPPGRWKWRREAVKYLGRARWRCCGLGQIALMSGSEQSQGVPFSSSGWGAAEGGSAWRNRLVAGA